MHFAAVLYISSICILSYYFLRLFLKHEFRDMILTICRCLIVSKGFLDLHVGDSGMGRPLRFFKLHFQAFKLSDDSTSIFKVCFAKPSPRRPVLKTKCLDSPQRLRDDVAPLCGNDSAPRSA
jgi:hypothetical protein